MILCYGRSLRRAHCRGLKRDRARHAGNDWGVSGTVTREAVGDAKSKEATVAVASGLGLLQLCQSSAAVMAEDSRTARGAETAGVTGTESVMSNVVQPKVDVPLVAGVVAAASL